MIKRNQETKEGKKERKNERKKEACIKTNKTKGTFFGKIEEKTSNSTSLGKFYFKN